MLVWSGLEVAMQAVSLMEAKQMIIFKWKLKQSAMTYKLQMQLDMKISSYQQK